MKSFFCLSAELYLKFLLGYISLLGNCGMIRTLIIKFGQKRLYIKDPTLVISETELGSQKCRLSNENNVRRSAGLFFISWPHQATHATNLSQVQYAREVRVPTTYVSSFPVGNYTSTSVGIRIQHLGQ